MMTPTVSIVVFKTYRRSKGEVVVRYGVRLNGEAINNKNGFMRTFHTPEAARKAADKGIVR